MKNCPRCRTKKSLDEFWNSSWTSDGKQAYCKACQRVQRVEQLRKDPEGEREKASARYRAGMEKHKANSRKSHLRRKFGLTPECFLKMLAEQGGGCAICNKKSGAKKSLAVDHCHRTEKVRGLLCDQCNRILGLAYDSAETLRSAATYLDRHQEKAP